MPHICDSEHRHHDFFESLPNDQGGHGRHKCAGCAYNQGLEAGKLRLESIEIDLDSLPESQASVVRHKSPHAAFALGYFHGVHKSYR